MSSAPDTMVARTIDLDIEVDFHAPALSLERNLPAMSGPGRARSADGRLVLEGRVFRLTAWWLMVFAPLLFLATAGLFVALRNVGLVIGLGSVVGLVIADFVQRRTGRAYRLVVPRGCGYRSVTVAGRTTLTIQLDTFVVGGGRRPPIVEVELDPAHAAKVQALLR